MNIAENPYAQQALLVLTWQLRVATADQLGRILAARVSSNRSVRSVARSLVSANLLASAHTVAAFVESTGPLFSWRPGGNPPKATAIAWQLEKRWREARARKVTAYWATKNAALRMGGQARFPGHAGQLEHDLGTASVLTGLYEIDPRKADDWVGEDILRRDYADRLPVLRKMPDGAVVVDDRIHDVHEFGGQYSAQRIRRFHRHFARHRIAYAIH